RALKRVSVARGLDPRQMALLPFGGAGPLFGCQLAEALGMRTIVIPPHPGALSALGLASAAERVDLLASFHRSLDGLSSRDLGNAFAPLLAEGRSQVPDGTVWALDELAAGVTIAGPAILAGRNATALVEPGWRGTVHPCGAVLVEHT